MTRCVASRARRSWRHGGITHHFPHGPWTSRGRTPQALEALHYFNSKNAGTGKPTQLMLHDRHCPGVTLARGRGWFVI
eukprot:s6099_g4.t1